MNTMRQRTLAAAVVAVATLGLTGCQDSAPPVAKSTASSTSSTDGGSSSASSSTSSDTPSSTESSSSSSESSTSSSSSSSTGGAVTQSSQAGACNNTSSYFIVKGGNTKVAKYGATQSVQGDTGNATLDLTVSKGEAKDGGSDYPYDDDTQALVFDVKFKRTSSDGFYVATPLAFSLVDESGRNCARASSGSNNVVLGKDMIDVESINDDKTEYGGKVVFVVPKNKDYSKYTFLWNGDYKGGTEAGYGWQG